MQLTFERSTEKLRKPMQLPAFYYNTLHLAFACAKDEAIFVPIRSLQYLAVIEKSEVNFVDGRRSRFIDVSWEKFTPQVREAIDDPVPYEWVSYETSFDEFHDRLMGEFFKALEIYREKNMPQNNCDATVIPFKF